MKHKLRNKTDLKSRAQEKPNQAKEKPSGRSMVEMLGVLAVVGVLSISGIAGYTQAMNRYKANEIVDMATKLCVIAQSKGYAHFKDLDITAPIVGCASEMYVSATGDHLSTCAHYVYGCARDTGLVKALKGMAQNVWPDWNGNIYFEIYERYSAK